MNQKERVLCLLATARCVYAYWQTRQPIKCCSLLVHVCFIWYSFYTLWRCSLQYICAKSTKHDTVCTSDVYTGTQRTKKVFCNWLSCFIFVYGTTHRSCEGRMNAGPERQGLYRCKGSYKARADRLGSIQVHLSLYFNLRSACALNTANFVVGAHNTSHGTSHNTQEHMSA